MKCNIAPNWQNVPYDKISDEKGFMSNPWRTFLSNTAEGLIGFLTPDGYVLPSRTAATIATLTGDKYVGRLIFDCTNQMTMVNNNGTFENIMTESMVMNKLNKMFHVEHKDSLETLVNLKGG